MPSTPDVTVNGVTMETTTKRKGLTEGWMEERGERSRGGDQSR